MTTKNLIQADEPCPEREGRHEPHLPTWISAEYVCYWCREPLPSPRDKYAETADDVDEPWDPSDDPEFCDGCTPEDCNGCEDEDCTPPHLIGRVILDRYAK